MERCARAASSHTTDALKLKLWRVSVFHEHITCTSHSHIVMCTHMTTHDTSPPISTTHMCTHIHKTTAHTHDSQQSIWRQLPDVPYNYSSVCVGDGVLLAIGGADQEYRSRYGHFCSVLSLLYDVILVSSTDNVLFAIGGEDQYGSKQTSSIYGLHVVEKKWRHVGDLPFACSRVDMLLSGGGLLMVDGNTHQVLKITVQGKDFCTEIELLGLFSGLAKLFPSTPFGNEADKSQKEADEWYGEHV